jgi:hypothetical protein
MGFDDRPANRQPHSYSAGFRGVESLENAFDMLRIDARPRVAHCYKDTNCLGFPRAVETRELLLKADKVSIVCERLADGKIRVTTSSWNDAVVIWPNQVLEVATVGKQVGLVRVDKPIAYLDIDDTGLVDAGYGPQA